MSNAPVKSSIEDNEVDLPANYANNDLVNYDFCKPKKSNLIINFDTPQHKSIQHSVLRMWSNVITNNSYSNYLETLTSAELRLFHRPWYFLGKYESLPTNLTIYRYKNGTRNYVNSVIVEADHQGWIVINITSLVQWWIDHPEIIGGVMCTTSPMENKDNLIVLSMLDDNGGSYSIGEFAVGYYNNLLNTKMNFRSNFKYKKNFPPGFDAIKNPDFCEMACKTNNFFTNFKTIGPKEWIISTDGLCCRIFIVIR
ncbi:Similar to DVR1: Protein DVR-1 homolog (Strongylocentrotus purpuratus) [Cotesia congregata]|uniref:Similar to DVR1: Protein DVR-1 homolog (Strongylocentrotus purpuratus) n=1 Tax=Cotesia congregata TaxID=51543 RepID=A0A8J2H1H6_COTCN|nr:Similar to DVR1: Protein DVR-1 homolog (Strongylocentrotus purpuratus) [Cotesia congregata]